MAKKTPAKKSTIKLGNQKQITKRTLALRAIFISSESKKPISNLPVIASVQAGNGRTIMDLIIAKLGTGINGYVSFKFNSSRLQEKSKLSIYPLGYESLKHSVEIDFLKSNDEYIHTIEIDEADIHETSREDLPQVQDPDIIDYRFLPMFSRNFQKRASDQLFQKNIRLTDDPNDPDSPLTTDSDTDNDTDETDCGCEDNTICSTIIPQIPNKESIIINQFKLNYSTEDLNYENRETEPVLKVKVGLINVYESCHTVIGHSLGTLINTIPLAPCESVNYSVKNWYRKDRSVRSDDITRNESLDSEIVKSKSTTEYIKSQMRESKFNFGLSAAAKFVGKALALNLGFATGKRKSSASMIQEVNETQKQLTNTYASYKSLVITETTQSESLEQSTRNITNHNHCHDLTIFQFEIKENILVSTSHLGYRKGIFVKYETPCFEIEDIMCYRHIFREVLLDSSLIHCLDDICLDNYSCDPSETSDQPDDDGTENCLPVVKLRVTAYIPLEGFGVDYLGNLTVKIKALDEEIETNVGDSASYDSGSYVKEIPIDNICLEDFEWAEWTFSGERIPIRQLTITYYLADSPDIPRLMYNRSFGTYTPITIGTASNLQSSINSGTLFPQLPEIIDNTVNVEQEVIENLVKEENCCKANILHHVNCNKLFYYKILWLLEDENQRAVRLKDYFLDEVSLMDIIDNTPVGVLGNYVVFEAADTELIIAEDPLTDEIVLNSPTGNLYSEAILGQCNGCEVIDDSRFWDWTGKTCPNNAPAITDENLSKFQAIASAFSNPFNQLTPAAFSSLSGASTLSGLIQEMMKTSIVSDPGNTEKTLENLITLIQDQKDPSDESSINAVIDQIVTQMDKYKKLFGALEDIFGNEDE